MRNVYTTILVVFITLMVGSFAAVATQPVSTATPARAAQELLRLEKKMAVQQTLLYCAAALCLAVIACTVALYLSRQKLVENKDNEISRKNRDLLDIQDQVYQANEELRVINTNLEGIVHERTLTLGKVNREMDMFLYRASHDLRRPITTLMGLVEVSKLGFDEASGRMLFGKIHDTAVNMDNMLEKFSMINTINQDSFECCEVDFREIVENIRQSSMISTYSSHIRFDIQIDSRLRLVSEPNLVTFILKNLMDNAVIFRCRHASRQPIIRLTIKQMHGTVGIELHDNGIGIPQTMLPEIFHLFYRGSEASKGNGLGLYVVQKAIGKLNGEIKVESCEHEWTRIHITLPQAEAPTIAMHFPAAKLALA